MIRLRPSGADEVLIKRVRDWYEPGPGVFIAPQALFNPALLFTTGVNGTWYDPSDIRLTWRRNLLTYSEQFDNAAWVKGGSSTQANITAAPDGSLTADSIIESAAAGVHRTVRSLTAATGSVYTLSVYAKLASGVRNVGLKIWDGGAVDRGNAFNLSTQTISTILGYSSADTASIVYVGSGWYRCSITVTSGASATGDISIMLVNGNLDSYTGDGTSGIYIWGAQLEQGSTATPYQRITDGVQDYLSYQAQPVLYQDAAGTTPVTAVEQPVGLMLDKSKGLVLGPELVTNGDFSQGTTGWTTNINASISAPSGALVVANATGATADVRAGTSAGFATVIGQTYRVQAICVAASGYNGTINFAAANGPTGPTVTSQNVAIGVQATFVFVATSTTTHVFAGATIAVGATFTVDNISVRELPGNHAFNASGNSANFPVLSARYNLLTKTEDFSSAVWIKTGLNAFGSGSVVDTTATYDPNGGNTADFIQENLNATSHDVVFGGAASLVPGNAVVASVYVKKAGRTRVTFGAYGAGPIAFRGFDLQSVSSFAMGGSLVDPTAYSIVDVGNGWCKISVTYTATASGTIALQLMMISSGTTYSYTGDGTSGIYLWGADLRIANDALNQPAYQRVNTATDYDTAGFKPYLRFNGTNQWLQTNSIDFSYGDKMFVCAGVRKLSDAARGILVELSASPSTNFFNIEASGPTAGANFGSLLAGSAITSVSATTFTSPVTSVVTVQDDISKSTRETELLMRVNGVVPTLTYANATDAGTGNFGNYPLYIGARAGSSLWFNGRLHQLVVAGKQASASEVGQTEAFTNQKTGAY